MKGSAVSKRVLILFGQVVYSFILILLISGIPVLFQGLKLNIGAYAAFVQEMGMKVLFLITKRSRRGVQSFRKY